MTAMYMPGATAVGITYNDGVVFASERRIAYGNFVVSNSKLRTLGWKPVVTVKEGILKTLEYFESKNF